MSIKLVLLIANDLALVWLKELVWKLIWFPNVNPLETIDVETL